MKRQREREREGDEKHAEGERGAHTEGDDGYSNSTLHSSSLLPESHIHAGGDGRTPDLLRTLTEGEEKPHVTYPPPLFLMHFWGAQEPTSSRRTLSCTHKPADRREGKKDVEERGERHI